MSVKCYDCGREFKHYAALHDHKAAKHRVSESEQKKGTLILRFRNNHKDKVDIRCAWWYCLKSPYTFWWKGAHYFADSWCTPTVSICIHTQSKCVLTFGTSREHGGAMYTRDNHGHLWYCFSCKTNEKDHKSFNSNSTMLNHLNECHGAQIK